MKRIDREDSDDDGCASKPSIFPTMSLSFHRSSDELHTPSWFALFVNTHVYIYITSGMMICSDHSRHMHVMLVSHLPKSWDMTAFIFAQVTGTLLFSSCCG